jgi:hypothetical protein
LLLPNLAGIMATYIDLVELIWTRQKLPLRHGALDFNHSLQTRGLPFGFGRA